jgi:ABC-type bacteriocin/lantibiotic exporter with double-glycine peptidase domain
MNRSTAAILFLAMFAAILPARADSRFVDTQSTESDCGPAALSTLLTYYLDVPTTEREMVKLTGARPEIGTTFLAMEAAAKAKGCAADGFRMTFDTLREQLRAYPTPVIVRMLMPEPHFMVVLAIDHEYVYLADPAVGNIVLRTDAFLKRWIIPASANQPGAEGYVFVAAGPAEYNDANRLKIVQGLAQQLRNLRVIRQPLPAFRR